MPEAASQRWFTKQLLLIAPRTFSSQKLLWTLPQLTNFSDSFFHVVSPTTFTWMCGTVTRIMSALQHLKWMSYWSIKQPKHKPPCCTTISSQRTLEILPRSRRTDWYNLWRSLSLEIKLHCNQQKENRQNVVDYFDKNFESVWRKQANYAVSIFSELSLP